MFMDICIAVALAVVTFTTAYLGVHVSLHPTEDPDRRALYKWAFIVCGIIGVTLLGSQTYRNLVAQNALTEKLNRIDSNTKATQTKEVTPSASVNPAKEESKQANQFRAPIRDGTHKPAPTVAVGGDVDMSGDGCQQKTIAGSNNTNNCGPVPLDISFAQGTKMVATLRQQKPLVGEVSIVYEASVENGDLLAKKIRIF